MKKTVSVPSGSRLNAAPAPTQVQLVKAKLDPRLNEPYFKVETMTDRGMSKKCAHKNFGVELQTPERRVVCRNCGAQVDAFDALLDYASAEQRLVSTRNDIIAAEQRELARKVADKARRPFVRKVAAWLPQHDMTLKSEPIIGYSLKLECGHTRESSNPDRKPKTVTCADCALEARKQDRIAAARAARP